jgi:hypothetical protein
VWRWLRWVVAVTLTFAVGFVAVDAARRATTLGVFLEGHGEPVRSPPEAFKAAEWNLVYLLGLAVGVATGLGLSAAAALYWRLVRSRRLDGVTPGHSPRQGGGS